MLAGPIPTPERIVEPDGSVHVGWFERAFRHANIEDAPAAHALARLRGPIERVARRFRLKQWHYTSVVTDRMLFACAVVDAAYVGHAFAYVVDRTTGRCHRYGTTTPLAAGVHVAANSTEGSSWIRWPGFGTLALSTHASRGERRIEVDLRGRRRGAAAPPLSASIVLRDDGRDPEPMVVVEALAPGRWIYTHKCYGLRAEGRVSAGGIDHEFDFGEGLAGFDFNRGHRPRDTYWNWAAAAGRTRDGRRVAFNLTANAPPDAVPRAGEPLGSDSVLWLEGARVKVGPVSFEYDPSDRSRDWHVRDREGLVDLRFVPLGERAEFVNAGIVASRFRQPYGRFEGELRSRDGFVAAFDDVFGVVEQHDARW